MQFLLILFLLAVPIAADAAGQAIESRDARHIVMPFIGYQILNGEEMGAGFTLTQSSSLFPDTVFTWRGHYTTERDAKAPALGINYRFRYNRAFEFEATAGVIHDETSVRYSAVLPVYQYTQRFNIDVSRSNTAFITAGGVYNLPLNDRWFGFAVKVNTGYAYRSINMNKGGTTNASGTITHTTFSFDDAESMLIVGGGAEATVWRGRLLLVRAGISYTQFLPMGDSDVSPFGGIGWQVCLFPIWGGR